MGYTNAYDDDDDTATFTAESLFAGIGAEFGLAFAPIVARLAAIEESNMTMQKALDQQMIIAEEMADRTESLCKALGATPAYAQARPFRAQGTQQPATHGDRFTDAERAETNELLQKGLGILREYSVTPSGLRDAIDASNDGTFSRQHLAALREGIQKSQQTVDMMANTEA